MATFEEALKCMREGKKVNPCCHSDWKCIYHLDMDKREIILDVYDDDKLFQSGVSSTFNFDEIMAEDWEVVEDDNK